MNVIGDVDHNPDVRGVAGIPVTGWNRSVWNRASTALSELGLILKGTRAQRVVLSYSTDGIMKAQDIAVCFTKNGWECSKYELSQRRFKSHSLGAQNKRDLRELLFVAKKKP